MGIIFSIALILWQGGCSGSCQVSTHTNGFNLTCCSAKCRPRCALADYGSHPMRPAMHVGQPGLNPKASVVPQQGARCAPSMTAAQSLRQRSLEHQQAAAPRRLRGPRTGRRSAGGCAGTWACDRRPPLPPPCPSSQTWSPCRWGHSRRCRAWGHGGMECVCVYARAGVGVFTVGPTREEGRQHAAVHVPSPSHNLNPNHVRLRLRLPARATACRAGQTGLRLLALPPRVAASAASSPICARAQAQRLVLACCLAKQQGGTGGQQSSARQKKKGQQ